MRRHAASVKDVASARVARKTLSTFAGSLKVHLAMEDKTLYPELLGKGGQTGELAEQFVQEMGTIAGVLGDFSKRWGNPEDIASDRARFAEETSQLVEAVGDRISRENTQLFPLADAG